MDPGLNVASISVPLVPPQTEFGDRINQLDLNVTKTVRIGRASVQPKIDFFNLLNQSSVYAVRTLNYGTTAYNQPSSILVGRVFQLGAIVKFRPGVRELVDSSSAWPAPLHAGRAVLLPR